MLYSTGLRSGGTVDRRVARVSEVMRDEPGSCQTCFMVCRVTVYALIFLQTVIITSCIRGFSSRTPSLMSQVPMLYIPKSTAATMLSWPDPLPCQHETAGFPALAPIRKTRYLDFAMVDCCELLITPFHISSRHFLFQTLSRTDTLPGAARNS
jgi:hypothetical protein